MSAGDGTCSLLKINTDMYSRPPFGLGVVPVAEESKLRSRSKQTKNLDAMPTCHAGYFY